MSTVQTYPQSIEYWLPVIEEAVGGYHVVELLETPLSWLYLTTQHVYKIKKPLDIGASRNWCEAHRHQACLEEVRLNQRLAPGVYLGVVPIAEHADGSVRLSGRGLVLEYAVKMRRLCGDHNLIYLIEHGGLSLERIETLARVLADFYRRQPPQPTALATYSRRLSQRISVNMEAVQDLLQPSLQSRFRKLSEAQSRFIEQAQSLLNVRVCDGRIVDGHGDLRAEHVFFERQPLIIDCLEYSAPLRAIDPLDDLSCLAVELENLGRHDVSETLIGRYRSVANDAGSPSLEALYKSLNATTRAAELIEVSSRCGRKDVDDCEVNGWLDLANRYCHERSL